MKKLAFVIIFLTNFTLGWTQGFYFSNDKYSLSEIKDEDFKNKIIKVCSMQSEKDYADGDYHLKQKNYAYALVKYNEAINAGKRSSWIFFKKAICEIEMNRYQEAINSLTLSETNANKKALEKRSYFNEDIKLRYNKEKMSYDTVIFEIVDTDLLYSHSDIYRFRGISKFHMDDFYGAKNDLLFYHKLDTSILTMYYLGMSYLSLNQYNEGKLCFINTINLADNENNLEILRNSYLMRGLCLYHLGEKEKGCIDYSTAGELGHPKVYDYIKAYCK